MLIAIHSAIIDSLNFPMSTEPAIRTAAPAAVIDLGAYCRRIGYSGPLAPTLATLRALHEAHVGSISFENLNPLLGIPVGLDSESLQRKMVFGRRGGYCFEQNLLFKDVLEAIGFRVHGLAARVRMGTTDTRARTHMVLRVAADGRDYLADVGFGGDGLLEPVPLIAGTDLNLPIVPVRLLAQDGLWVLQAKQTGDWSDLYAFTLEPQERVDYQVANFYTANWPESVFRKSLTAQRVRRHERLILRNRDLTILRLGETQKREIRSAAEATLILDRLFGVEVPAGYAIPEQIFS